MPTDRLIEARRKAMAWERQEGVVPHLTHADLDVLAEQAVIELRECGNPTAQRSDFTCHGCGGATMCPYVYDPYNISGDCLADK